MNTETNPSHSFTEGSDAHLDAGAYKFEKPDANPLDFMVNQPLDLDAQYQRLEEQYKEHKAKAREHTAAASEINSKMKKLDAERRRQERRLKDILE